MTTNPSVNDKTPQAGEYWVSKDDGSIQYIVGINTKGEAVFETKHGLLWQSDYWDNWYHEPLCTGFDWVKPPAEVWPKYVVKDSWTTEAYIRRDTATVGTIVLRNGTVNERLHYWDKDHESFIESGSWRYVTEFEALARVAVPQLTPFPDKFAAMTAAMREAKEARESNTGMTDAEFRKRMRYYVTEILSIVEGIERDTRDQI